MAKRNPYPVKASTFAFTKYISSTNDCIDDDFDELTIPAFQLLDIPLEIQHAS